MRLVLLGLLLALAGAACSQNGKTDPGPGGAGTAASEASWPSELPPLKFLRRTPKVGPPRAFTLHPDVVVTSEQFIQHYAPLLWGLGPADELRPERTHEGVNGHVNTRYAQFHSGYPVEGGSVVLTTRKGRVVSGGGDPLGGLDSLKLEVRVSKEAAITRALERMASALGVDKDKLDLYKEPEARLEIIEKPRRLAWRVIVVALPLAARSVALDAATGEVLTDRDVTSVH